RRRVAPTRCAGGRAGPEALQHNSTTPRAPPGPKNKNPPRRCVHGFVRQMVIYSVLRRHVSADVIAAKDFGRPVLPIACIDSDDRGQKAGGEGIPRDVILMKTITFCAGWLEDQLILEETCALSIELSHEIEHLRTARNAFVRRAEIDDRVEAVEAAFPRLEVILPAAADVIAID